jgi:hypothetical protein
MRLVRRILANLLFGAGILFTAALLTLSAILAELTYWLRQLHLDPYACLPRPEFVRGQLTIPYTDQCAVAGVARYNDEVEAFLYFQFLRGRVASDGVRVLLTETPGKSGRPIASWSWARATCSPTSRGLGAWRAGG